MTVIRTDVGEGWWEGTNSKGETGLFPEAYVEDYDAVEDDSSGAPPAAAPPPLPPDYGSSGGWNNPSSAVAAPPPANDDWGWNENQPTDNGGTRYANAPADDPWNNAGDSEANNYNQASSIQPRDQNDPFEFPPSIRQQQQQTSANTNQVTKGTKVVGKPLILHDFCMFPCI